MDSVISMSTLCQCHVNTVSIPCQCNVNSLMIPFCGYLNVMWTTCRFQYFFLDINRVICSAEGLKNKIILAPKIIIHIVGWLNRACEALPIDISNIFLSWFNFLESSKKSHFRSEKFTYRISGYRCASNLNFFLL